MINRFLDPKTRLNQKLKHKSPFFSQIPAIITLVQLTLRTKKPNTIFACSKNRKRYSYSFFFEFWTIVMKLIFWKKKTEITVFILKKMQDASSYYWPELNQHDTMEPGNWLTGCKKNKFLGTTTSFKLGHCTLQCDQSLLKTNARTSIATYPAL